MIYFISDYHLGQESKAHKRNFKNLDEMHNFIISSWNKTISSKDSVYILGDVSLDFKYLSLLDRMNGNKFLIKGNHDKFNSRIYLKYFVDIYGVKYIFYNKFKFVLTHYPIHDTMLKENEFNIHGHTHEYNIGNSKYINVSCEVIEYKPISILKIMEKIKDGKSN